VVDLAVLGLRLDSMILKVFPNLNDSMILNLANILEDFKTGALRNLTLESVLCR